MNFSERSWVGGVGQAADKKVQTNFLKNMLVPMSKEIQCWGLGHLHWSRKLRDDIITCHHTRLRVTPSDTEESQGALPS